MTVSTTDTRGKSAEGVLGSNQRPKGYVEPRYSVESSPLLNFPRSQPRQIRPAPPFCRTSACYTMILWPWLLGSGGRTFAILVFTLVKLICISGTRISSLKEQNVQTANQPRYSFCLGIGLFMGFSPSFDRLEAPYSRRPHIASKSIWSALSGSAPKAFIYLRGPAFVARLSCMRNWASDHT